MPAFEGHEFYCTKCGRPTIPLARKRGHRHEQFHRKHLYCPWCRTVECCIEIANDIEKQQFLKDFMEGKYE